MHLWLLQLAALCSRSDNGCHRVLSHPSWNDAQRAAGTGLVGTGAGTCPSLAPGWGGPAQGHRAGHLGSANPAMTLQGSRSHQPGALLSLLHQGQLELRDR